MNSTVFDLQMVVTAVLMLISLIFGLFNLEIARPHRNTKWTTASHKYATGTFIFVNTLVYVVVAMAIVFKYESGSWITSWPMWARALCYDPLYLFFATVFNMVWCSLAIIIGQCVKKMFLKRRVEELNFRREDLMIDHIIFLVSQPSEEESKAAIDRMAEMPL